MDDLVKERDLAWIQAMAVALGTNSGFKIPIVPEEEPFRDLLTEVRLRIFKEALAACADVAAYHEERAKFYLKRVEEPHELSVLNMDLELATHHLRDRETALRVKATIAARMEKP